MLILGGLWGIFFGYAVAYAGVAKLSGDIGCTIGRAMRGQCTLGTAGHGGPAPGRTRWDTGAAARAQQLAAIGDIPFARAA